MKKEQIKKKERIEKKVKRLKRRIDRFILKTILTSTIIFAILYLIAEPTGAMTIHIIMGKIACLLYFYILMITYTEYKEELEQRQKEMIRGEING